MTQVMAVTTNLFRDRDLFVHYSGIDGQGFKSLPENSKVEYEEEAGDKGPKAVNVRAI